MTGRVSQEQCRQVDGVQGPLIKAGGDVGGAGRGDRVLGYQGGEGGDVSTK